MSVSLHAASVYALTVVSWPRASSCIGTTETLSYILRLFRCTLTFSCSWASGPFPFRPSGTFTLLPGHPGHPYHPPLPPRALCLPLTSYVSHYDFSTLNSLHVLHFITMYCAGLLSLWSLPHSSADPRWPVPSCSSTAASTCTSCQPCLSLTARLSCSLLPYVIALSCLLSFLRGTIASSTPSADPHAFLRPVLRPLPPRVAPRNIGFFVHLRREHELVPHGPSLPLPPSNPAPDWHVLIFPTLFRTPTAF